MQSVIMPPIGKAPQQPDLAVIVKTVPDRISLLNLIISSQWALQSIPPKYYISDEYPLPRWKEQFYEHLSGLGHYVRIGRSGEHVTTARNRLVSELDGESLILRADDDFELGGEFRLGAMLALLNVSRDYSFVSDVERQIGQAKSVRSGDLRIQSGFIRLGVSGPQRLTLMSDKSWKYGHAGRTRFASADYMRNLILVKRCVFESVRWNEDLSFSGEHLDFFLRLKSAGYVGAFTPDSIHLHRDDLKSAIVDPQEERLRRTESASRKEQVFASNWGGVEVRRPRQLGRKVTGLTRLVRDWFR